MLGAFGSRETCQSYPIRQEKRENRGGKKSKDRVAWPRDRNRAETARPRQRLRSIDFKVVYELANVGERNS